MRPFRNRYRPEARRSPPSWQGVTGGPRVLVEHPDASVRDILQRHLEEHGYQAAVCSGPTEDDERLSCPVLRQEQCPGVEGADAIVSGLDFRQDVNRMIVSRIYRSHPHRPLILDTPTDVRDERGLAIGANRQYHMTASSLIGKLDALLSKPSAG